ncbi:MAG: SRPBCC domain-containing protein [Gemmatimonadota bacterium]
MIDAIERTLELAATPERVWRALTDPEELARWFPDRVEGTDLAAGSEGWFWWEDHGRYAFRLEAVEPPHRLVWRWAREKETPVDGATTTQVEWTLEPRAGGGTTLRLRESGFLRPEDREDNVKGWAAELAELEALLAA